MTNFTRKDCDALAKLGKVAGVEWDVYTCRDLYPPKGLPLWFEGESEPSEAVVTPFQLRNRLRKHEYTEQQEHEVLKAAVPCPSVFDAEQLLVDAAEKLNVVHLNFKVQYSYAERLWVIVICQYPVVEYRVTAPTRHGAIILMAEKLILKFEEVSE